MSEINTKALFNIGYGLYAVTCNDTKKDNALIVNTVCQLTSNPLKVSVTINKENYSHDIIRTTGKMNVNCLSETAPFDVFKKLGFASGRDTDKFSSVKDVKRTENGLLYLTQYSNAVISGKVIEEVDCGTHTLFIADVTEALKLSDEKSVTYQYYFDHIKPKPEEKKKGYVCKICGYVYEGSELPEDFICPWCKHPASDFEPIK